MKFKFFVFMLFSGALICNAQNIVGNGGDVVASEFNAIARTAVYFLKQNSLSQPDRQLVLEIEKTIETTLVESVDEVLLIGDREVDAINYPSLNQIKISRKRWEQIRLRTPSERTMIVLHEYIWIAGTDDGSYATSSRLVTGITKDLNQNSISTEKYQSTLAEYYVELNLFRADILGMQAAGKMDLSAYCFAAGSLKAHTDRVSQLTNENAFWFSAKQMPEVQAGLEFINLFANEQVGICRSGATIDFNIPMNGILKAAEITKYLMMITQFSESEL